MNLLDTLTCMVLGFLLAAVLFTLISLVGCIPPTSAALLASVWLVGSSLVVRLIGRGAGS